MDPQAESLLAEARNPSTRPERLYEIARLAAREIGFRCEIVEATAANPNAPMPLLLYLLAFHPHTVMRNPALALGMVENPACLADAHSYSLLDILSQADAPAYLVNWLRSHPDKEVATAARLHVLAPNPGTSTWLQELRAHVRPRSRQMTVQCSELVRLGLMPPSLRTILKGPLKSPRSRPAVRSAWSLAASAAPIRFGSEELRASERLRAARQSTCPEALHRLALDRRAEVRAAVGRNPAATPEIRARLAEDPSVEVRRCVLSSPQTGEPLLRHAVLGGGPMTQPMVEAILSNPNTTEELIEALSEHPACRCTSGLTVLFRLGAALHPHTSPRILAELANEAGLEIRYWLALHPRFPAEAMPRLRETALRATLRNDNPTLLAAGMSHPELPTALLAVFVSSFNWLHRAALALNPNLEEPHLRTLAEDGNRIVRDAARARLNGEPIPDLWSRR